MAYTIEHLDLEQTISIYRFLSSYAFHPTPPLPDFDSFAEKFKKMKGSEHYVLIVEEYPQTIASAKSLTQNIRGKIFPMGGIASVASHPSARRKGYVKTLIKHIFNTFREQGVPVSCLYPFKESFYHRFGYVTFPQAKKILFDPQKLSPLLEMDLDGEFMLVKFGKGYLEFRKFLLDLQHVTHGMSLFTDANPEAAEDRESWLVFARHNHQIVGVMQYDLTGDIMDQHLKAYDFLFRNTQGKFMLLNWIARHIDQATQVELTLSPNIHGENLFTGITPEHAGLFRPPMGRVIDIKGLAGLPSGEGEITINISDPSCDWNNGIWKLEGSNGSLQITSGTKPDCDLTIHGLAALVYGVYDPETFLLRGWGNPDKAQQAILRQMFPLKTPFLLAMY